MSQGIRNGALAVAVLVGMFGIGAAQAQGITQRSGTGATSAIPAIEDWSTRTRIQGKPLYPDEFEASGRLADMQALYTDPRYVAGVLRRVEGEGLRQAPSRAGGEATATSDRRRGHGSPGNPGSPGGTADAAIVRDWSNVLGGGNGGKAALGMYPAKYNFDIFAAPSCANDFVVYGTNAPGATDTLSTREQWTGTFSATNSTTGTITLGYGGGRSITLTASTTLNTGSNFLVASGTDDAVRNNKADNLVAAINRWTSTTGIVADRPGDTGQVRLTSLASGPQDFTVTQTGNGAGFTLFTQLTNGTGTPGQPTIIAYNQLYQGTCNGSWNQNGATKAPNVMWAYNTGTDYVVETSPVLSYFDNGRQVAFIQRFQNSLQLVLLKWRATNGTAALPVAPTLSASPTDYRNCIDNCYLRLPLDNDAPNNVGGGPTYSSPYVDYATDTLWVGDGNSRLHKFTGVFQGIPAEVTTGGFPVAVEATGGLALSPPVADETYVYVGSESGGPGVGDKVYRIPVAGGSVVASTKLGADDRAGVRSAMILDSALNKLYAFVFSSTGTATPGLCTHTTPTYIYCRAVFQFDTSNFSATPVKAQTGLGSITGESVALWMGAFDEAYYTKNGSGAMYICGGSLPRTQQTHLWKIPFTNGVMGTPVIGPQIGVDDNDIDTIIYNCSPPTVIKNGSNEYLYVSVSGAGPVFASAPGCGAAADTDPLSACMYMFNLSDLQTAVAEQWTFSFTGNQTTTGGTLNVNGTIFQASGTTTSCAAGAGTKTFRVDQGNADTDAANLRSCITSAAVSGFTVSGTGANVILTRTTTGNVADTMVQEGTNMNNFSETTASHIQGASVTDWTSASVPRAALQAPGGTGGIIVDNVTSPNNTTVGSQQIYFGQGGTTGNAVQASQSGLQ